jgi:hypothetical protein
MNKVTIQVSRPQHLVEFIHHLRRFNIDFSITTQIDHWALTIKY